MHRQIILINYKMALKLLREEDEDKQLLMFVNKKK